jgi:hypothetical protein
MRRISEVTAGPSRDRSIDSGRADEPGEPGPPQPPEIKREFKLHPYQQIGLPLLFFLPFVALLGLMDERFAASEGRSPDITLKVRYPSRFRYPMHSEIEVYVRNATSRTADTLSVRFDPEYLSEFEVLQFVPEASQFAVIELMNVGPGEERRVLVSIEGRNYWKHTGSVTASCTGLESATAQLSTLVFP